MKKTELAKVEDLAKSFETMKPVRYRNEAVKSEVGRGKLREQVKGTQEKEVDKLLATVDATAKRKAASSAATALRRYRSAKNPASIEEIEVDDDDDLVELEASEADEDLDGASNVLENPRRYARENPGVVSGAIVGGTVAVAAGGWWLWRRRERAKLVAMVKANPVAAHAYPKIEQVAAKHISYFNTTTAEQAWEALDPNGLLSLGGSVWGTK